MTSAPPQGVHGPFLSYLRPTIHLRAFAYLLSSVVTTTSVLLLLLIQFGHSRTQLVNLDYLFGEINERPDRMGQKLKCESICKRIREDLSKRWRKD